MIFKCIIYITSAKYYIAKYGITTGIKDVKQNNVIQLYPNPASNELNISIENNENKINTVFIYNSLMQKINEIEYKNDPISVKDLPTVISIK